MESPYAKPMPESFALKVTRRGQITLPDEALAALEIEPGGRVYLRIEDGELRLLRMKYTLEEVRGSLKPPKPDFDIEVAIREAKEEMADEAARKMRNGRG